MEIYRLAISTLLLLAVIIWFGMFFRAWELLKLDKGVRLYGEYATLSKVYTSQVNKKDLELYGHPTIKPLPLVQRLVCNSTQEGDLVLDPFLGSGTTAVACHISHRHYIGFENNRVYYEKAQERLNAEKLQLYLF